MLVTNLINTSEISAKKMLKISKYQTVNFISIQGMLKITEVPEFFVFYY